MGSINKRKLLGTATAASACIVLNERLALAQQSAKPRVLGMPINGGPSPLVDSVRRQLAEDFAKLGYIEQAVSYHLPGDRRGCMTMKPKVPVSSTKTMS